MKNHISIIVLLAVLFLAGCIGVKTSQPTPERRSTALPPGVTNEPLPTAAGESPQSISYIEQTPTPTRPNPTQEPPSPTAVPPTATLEAAAPTPVQATPTAEAATPTPAAVQPAAAAAGTAAAEGCVDKAAYYADVTIPDGTSFKQNVDFVKTWQIKNEGTCTWDGYRLVFGGGSILNAPISNNMPVVKPNELVNLSVNLTSANRGGLYTGLWQFENKDGKRFGVNSGGLDYIWVKISVTEYPDGATDPGVTTLPALSSNCALQPKPANISQVLDLVNKSRLEKGLNALVLNNQLSAAAQGHSEDMACKDYTAHVGSDGSSWYDRIKRVGYPYTYASENIFYGDPNFADPPGAVDWWLHSPTHYANMMSTKVSEIGIGYALNPKSSYQGYYTVNFAKR